MSENEEENEVQENGEQDQPKPRRGKKPRMYYEFTRITPAMAREWLSVPPVRPPRSIRQRTVDKILHAIDNKQWKEDSPQAIALAPDGSVIDGRHRLTAIASQRKSVWCQVAFDCNPDTYDVIDTGAGRSPGDVLKIAGYTDVNVRSASTRIVLAYEEVVETTRRLGTVTNSMTNYDVRYALDETDIGKAIEGALRPSTVVAKEIDRFGLRTSLCAMMALLQLHSQYGMDSQEEFFARLGDGTHLGADSPIYVFRQWLTSRSKTNSHYMLGGAYRPTAFLSVGIRCWNDYATGESRTSIRWRPGKEIIPRIL